MGPGIINYETRGPILSFLKHERAPLTKTSYFFRSNTGRGRSALILRGLLPILFLSSVLQSQSVPVGKGSYSLSLPSGAVGVQNAAGQSIQPKVASGFSSPVQSNDFWSSLIFPFRGDPYSNVLFAHPLNLKAEARGLQLGYTEQHILAANDYLYPFYRQLTVAVEGLNAASTLTEDYSDWLVTASWSAQDKGLEALFGHGLPYVFFRRSGADILIHCEETPSVWYDEDGVLGITVQGRHYGIFAPSGSVWTGSAAFSAVWAGVTGTASCRAAEGTTLSRCWSKSDLPLLAVTTPKVSDVTRKTMALIVVAFLRMTGACVPNTDCAVSPPILSVSPPPLPA